MNSDLARTDQVAIPAIATLATCDEFLRGQTAVTYIRRALRPNHATAGLRLCWQRDARLLMDKTLKYSIGGLLLAIVLLIALAASIL